MLLFLRGYLEHDSHLAALVRARLGFCSQYLHLPLSIARTELGFAISRWMSDSFDTRWRGAVEHLALQEYSAGEWRRAAQTMDAALTALEGTITLPAMSAASALRASKSFLRGLSAYCMVRDGRLNEALIALERSRVSSSLRAASDVPLAPLLERIPAGVTAVLPVVTEHWHRCFPSPSRVVADRIRACTAHRYL